MHVCCGADAPLPRKANVNAHSRTLLTCSSTAAEAPGVCSARVAVGGAPAAAIDDKLLVLPLPVVALLQLLDLCRRCLAKWCTRVRCAEVEAEEALLLL